MTAIQLKSTKATFEDVVLHYKQHFRKNMKKVINIWRILEVLPANIESFSFFMLRDGTKENKNNLLIEFHVEKGNGSILHTVIKHKEYWEEVGIFDKKVRYKHKWDQGHIFIECNYSLGVEKICAYISEFIYQIKSRIESIIGGSK